MFFRKLHCFLWHLWLATIYFVKATFIRIFTRDKIKRRLRYLHNNARISQSFIRSFKIELQINHPERLREIQNSAYLAVSNHTTYLDIILLASMEQFVFITSTEMRGIPFLGKITRNGGCLYTNRNKYVSLPAEIDNFAATLQQGFKVLLFPEGTSTDGRTVHPFHKSLFQIALKAKCLVLPLCIKYIALDGKKIDNDTQDTIFWYGDMPFLKHYFKLIGHQIAAEIDILEAVPYQENRRRQELSDLVYSQILLSYLQRESFIDKQCGSIGVET
ncbi:MAG: lysophospholipid acyltransferase family protein [Candidatus Cloacimonas sp.]